MADDIASIIASDEDVTKHTMEAMDAKQLIDRTQLTRSQCMQTIKKDNLEEIEEERARARRVRSRLERMSSNIKTIQNCDAVIKMYVD